MLYQLIVDDQHIGYAIAESVQDALRYYLVPFVHMNYPHGTEHAAEARMLASADTYLVRNPA